MRCLTGLLLLLLLVAQPAAAQDAFEQQRAADLTSMTGVDPILLTLIERRTTYRVGERIPLRLAFQPIGQVGLIRTGCGPGIGLDVVFDRRPGPYVPGSERDLSQGGFGSCGVIGGVYGGRMGEFDLGLSGWERVPPPPLPPVHEDVDLNEAVRVDIPGRYRFYVRTRFSAPRASGTPPRLSNIVTIDIVASDPAWEASVIARAASRLDAPELSGARASALLDLALLGSEAAVDLLVRRPDASILSVAWSARSREHLVGRMVERLDDPSLIVDHGYVARLAALEAARLAGVPGPTRTDYERLQREYSGRRLRALAAAGQLHAHLATAMQDASRGGRFNTYSRVVWKSLPAGFAAVPEAVERALAMLSPALQRFVLEDRLAWRELADPAFLPMFRRLAGSRAPDGPQDIALSMWFLHAPVQARRFAWRELASPQTHLGAAGIEALPVTLLPQFDDAMAARLEGAADAEGFRRAISVIERVGSGRIRRRVARVFERRAFAVPCPQGPIALAYFFRVDPAYAVGQLDRVGAAADGSTHLCSNSRLLVSVAQHRRLPAIEAAAIARLSDPRPWIVDDAAEMLRRYGSAAAEAALWRAFERWSQRWTPRATEFSRFINHSTEVDSALRVERALSEALVGGTRWYFDSPDESRRLALCVSEGCRSGTWAGSFSSEPPGIRVTPPLRPHASPHAFVGPASADDVAAALAQVAL